MKKVLLIGIAGIFSISVEAQTITAPTGQNLTLTNAVDVTGGGVNILSTSFFKIGGNEALGLQSNNIYIGTKPAASIGDYNTFTGNGAGYNNTTGAYNSFLGFGAGYTNSQGQQNFFFGAYSGNKNTIGSYNAFLGVNAGYNNDQGEKNVFIGNSAGYSNVNGKENTYIGYNSQGTAGIINSTAIGSNASVSTSNTVILGNAATTITGQGLVAGSSGLRFANLNASSAAVASGGSNKVLSVDGSGNVVLVALAGSVTTTATNPVAESTWKNADGYLYNNSTNGVVINGSGLDGNALIVKGGVLSKEVNVKVEGAESWPDYVFKPSYKRMSLEEVEKFISINGHLPNVASATEMAATGNNLNKTDIKLLEKVEELTLYLLDMKKANDAQSAEIQSLKNQMNKLKKNRK